MAAYASNATRADHRFNDRWWKVTGIIVKRIKGNAAWMTSAESPGFMLRVTFESKHDVMRINNGDSISVRCEGDGIAGEDEVRFEGCTLLSRSKPEPARKRKKKGKKKKREAPSDDDAADGGGDDDGGSGDDVTGTDESEDDDAEEAADDD